MKNYLSEFTGTFGFVFLGCGAIVFATPFIGYLGISLAFGAAYAAMGMAFKNHHFNPAITIAAAVAKRFQGKNAYFTVLHIAGYILMQVAGACAAVFLIYHIYSGKTGYVYQGSPDANVVERYTLSAAFWLESVLSFFLLCVFLGNDKSSDRRAVACGLFIAVACLLSYPITRGAINPARTTASALFCGEEALTQLSLFWASSLFAALLAGIVYHPYPKREKE